MKKAGIRIEDLEDGNNLVLLLTCLSTARHN